MLAADFNSVTGLEIIDVPKPAPVAGQVLMRVEACGICPGDVRASVGTDPDDRRSHQFGHETAGVVVEVGDGVDPWWLHKRVFAEGPGGYAEYKIADVRLTMHGSNIVVLPSNVSYEAGTFVEPLADCLFAVDRALRLGGVRAVAVIGCGQMGLQLTRVCVLAGLRVVASDPVEARRARALRFGAELTVDPTVDRVVEASNTMTRGEGVDCALVASPTPTALAEALESLKDGGKCILFSGYLPGDGPRIDAASLRRRRIDILPANWIAWEPALPAYDLYSRATELIASGMIDVESLIELRCDFERLNDAFMSVRKQESLKAVLVPIERCNDDLGAR